MHPLEQGITVPKSGDRLLGYTVERFLGVGSQGLVYVVRDELSGQRFALKLVTTQVQQLLDRVHRELDITRTIVHPHVVRVVDVLTYEDRPAIVVEYADGPTLSEFLEERSSVDYNEVATLARGIVSGLKAVHTAGMVHRDLCSATIRLGRVGEVWQPKLLDYGLVKQTEGAARTAAGGIQGTPEYLAPEQLQVDRRSDARSDLWALGVVLYELVTGRLPFTGETRTHLFGKVASGKYAGVLHLAPGAPDGLVRAIDACLTVDPLERPRSCADVEALIDGRALPEDPGIVPGDAGQTWTFDRAELDRRRADRTPTLALGLLVAALAATIGVLASWWWAGL